MNILFMTLLNIYDINEHTIYTDLLREFIKHGDSVYIVSPTERKNHEETRIIKLHNCIILKPRIGNVQKTNLIEKGFSTITLEGQIKKAIKHYYSNVKFDLVLYSTPPITLTSVIEYIKKRDAARTYLLLKDIFPQNSVDLGILSVTGWKSILYKYFRNKEKKLYALSDQIGCMSQANVDYVIKHNPEVKTSRVEVCPNSIEVKDKSITYDERNALRTKYGIPLDRIVFVYGGNLGKPQGIPFIIKCLKACKGITNAYFLIVGDGTEYGKLAEYINAEKPENVKLMKCLPKDEYDHMVASCDVGLIFLDYRFTIPNFPSRLLSYIQAGLLVLAATDTVTDIGKVIVDGGFGWWCESNDVDKFKELIKIATIEDLTLKKCVAVKYLKDNYSTGESYKIIVGAGENE